MKRKISISLSLLQKRHGDLRAVEIAKEIGADGIDFSLAKEEFGNPDSVYSKSPEEFAAYYSSIFEKAKELGLEISQVHGRYWMCCDTAEKTEIAMKNARLDIMAAHYLHSPYVIFHDLEPHDMSESSTLEVKHQINEMLFCRILEFAKEFDVKVAMETSSDDESKTFLFGQFVEFQKAYNRICAHEDNRERFFICVDTGHSNMAAGLNGNPPVGDVIRQLGSAVACLHLHDNNGASDQHRLPVCGDVDWKDVFDALDEIGYTGWYNLEPRLTQLRDFGKGFELEYAEFAVKMLRFMLHRRYGEGCCNYSEMDNSWLSYAKNYDRIN